MMIHDSDAITPEHHKPQAHQLLQEWMGLSAVCIISSLVAEQ